MLFVSLFASTCLASTETIQRTLEACPEDQLNCRVIGQTCGFGQGDMIALCSGELKCQSDDIIPATVITSSYIGTCQRECAERHIEGNFGICAPVCQVPDNSEPDKENWLTVLNEEYVTVDLCGNRCKCDATTGGFWCSDQAPCVPESPECQDITDWTDSEGEGCDWYASDPLFCLAFGETRAGDDDLTAVQACCVCGGGRVKAEDAEEFVMRAACPLEDTFIPEGQVLTTDECGSECTCTKKANGEFDWVCTKEAECEVDEGCTDMAVPNDWDETWVDMLERDCEWYADEPLNCLLYDQTPGSGGLTAFQACCACQGGEKALEDQKDDDTDNMPLLIAGVAVVLLLFCLCGTCVCLIKTKRDLNEYTSMEIPESDARGISTAI